MENINILKFPELLKAINLAINEDKTVEIKIEKDELTIISYRQAKRKKIASQKLRY